MNGKLINFIYALIIGRVSVPTAKTWISCNNIWQDEGAVRFFYDHFIGGDGQTYKEKILDD